MMRFREKRKFPAINSSASADVAFLLLIFFLVTTSMKKTEGIYRSLSSQDKREIKNEKEEIIKRNFLKINLTAANEIRIDNQPSDFFQLPDIIEAFILNEKREDNLPQIVKKDIPLIGETDTYDQHIIALYIHPETEYETYITALNQIISVYNKLRESLSVDYFKRPYESLNAAQKESIRMILPEKVSEIIKEEENP